MAKGFHHNLHYVVFVTKFTVIKIDTIIQYSTQDTSFKLSVPYNAHVEINDSHYSRAVLLVILMICLNVLNV